MNPLTAFSQALSALVTEAGKLVVSVHGSRYAASGIHWHTGFIITSYESINLEDKIYVTLPDGSVVEVEVLGSDPTTDIAVLQLPQAVERVPSIAESTTSATLAIGNLVMGLGRSPEADLFASIGIVQTLGSAWRSSSGGIIDQKVCPDLNLSRKGAGGPLIDSEGNIIGFNTFGPRRRILTIPSSTINRVLTQIKEKGRVARPYLGIGLQAIQIPSTLQSQLSVTAECGLMVVSLDPAQAAENGGILLGDILIALNNTPMKDSQAFQFFLASQPIGQTLTVQLVRGGEQRQLNVIIGER